MVAPGFAIDCLGNEIEIEERIPLAPARRRPWEQPVT